MHLIAAVDQNWGIGRQGKLLFHIPEDMRHFQSTTRGNVVVMGRKTLMSLPGAKPLKDRINIVLTRDRELSVHGALVCHTLEELVCLLNSYDTDQIYVIGGSEIYALLLDYCDDAIITHVDAAVESDCFIPNLNQRAGWYLQELGEPHMYEGLTFRFARYCNRAPRSMGEVL